MRISVLVCLVALSSCLPGRTDATPPGAVPTNLVLRSYEVPNHGAQQLRSVLKDLLWFGSDGKDANRFVGRAEVGPDGRLVVLAPPDVHEGVKSLVASLASAPPRKEPGTARLDYWVVKGVPGEGELPANLNEVAAALNEVKKNDGPMAFTLVEKLTVSSLPDEHGSIDGRDTRVRQRITSVDGALVANLNLERTNQRVDTKVRLAPGVVAVLASAGMSGPEAGQSIYFVVRAADGAQ